MNYIIKIYLHYGARSLYMEVGWPLQSIQSKHHPPPLDLPGLWLYQSQAELLVDLESV